MNEHNLGRQYSPGAQKVTEAFSSSPEILDEYQRRGLIATNNLGLRMLVFDAGPDSDLWQFYARSLFTSGIPERLERARSVDPELWQASVSAYKTRGELMTSLVSSLQSYGPEDPRTITATVEIQAAEWQDVELRTRVFEIIDTEPLNEDDAMSLCR